MNDVWGHFKGSVCDYLVPQVTQDDFFKTS